jgi:hypothetical protein
LGNASIEDDEFWPKVPGTKARNERQSSKKPFILPPTHAKLSLVEIDWNSQTPIHNEDRE